MRRIVMLMLGIVGFAAAAHAQSSAIGFQAKLTGVSDGPHTMTFSLYDSETGGTPLQTVGPQDVIVQDGVVSTAIAFDPSNWTGDPRWVGLLVQGSVQTATRLEIRRVPFAEKVGSLLDASGQLVLTDGPGTARLGINTTPTNGLLHVQSINQETPPLYVESRLQNNPAPPCATIAFEDRDDLPYRYGRLDFIRKFADAEYQFIRAMFDDDTMFEVRQNGHIGGKSLSLGGFGQGASDLILNVDGRSQTRILTITGGSDLAEPFDVSTPEATDDGDDPPIEPAPGMVMSIDPEHPGKLRIADSAYDTKVAGVISGANGLAPGMVMGKEGDALTNGEHPVAMTGRVWVMADASLGAISPGDRLTTSSTPGHAMVASNPSKADGAVIGKAMTGLDEGRGMVLVLVNLQ